MQGGISHSQRGEVSVASSDNGGEENLNVHSSSLEVERTIGDQRFPGSPLRRPESVLRREESGSHDDTSPCNTQQEVTWHKLRSRGDEREILAGQTRQGNKVPPSNDGPVGFCSRKRVEPASEERDFDDGLGWLRTQVWAGTEGTSLNFCADMEPRDTAELSPNRKGLSPVRSTVSPIRSDAEDVVCEGLDKYNMNLVSPEPTTEVQLENEPIALRQGPVVKGCRRQFRQKNLDEIGTNSSCPSNKGPRIKNMPTHVGMMLTHSVDSSRQRSIHTETKSGLEVRDSQIINMNRLHCISGPPSQPAQHLTPRQIWDFVEQIGVRDKTNLEDVVRRIGDMEQRDWEAFQQLASVGQQNDVDKGSFGADRCSLCLFLPLLLLSSKRRRGVWLWSTASVCCVLPGWLCRGVVPLMMFRCSSSSVVALLCPLLMLDLCCLGPVDRFGFAVIPLVLGLVVFSGV
ncbi:hypothetical protein Ancab_019324 [Ancistrocladus abbreviatus]